MTRNEFFKTEFADEPAYRVKQLLQALYRPEIRSFNDISTLPAALRVRLQQLPFIAFQASTVLESKDKRTFKAMLTLHDGEQIETVLMNNRKGAWTICVSSQVGCAMRCGFCATGTMGFKRNLTSDEITDQYRFWMHFLADRPQLEQRISNIVFMGMGEPLANYAHVKEAINEWLNFVEIGPTRITVSTVGMLPQMEKLLTDPEWPGIKFAVSLHSADRTIRKEIVPTSYPDFLPRLQQWCKEYLQRFGTRGKHLTFEYVMLDQTNDSLEDAKKLANYVNRTGPIKVNLIPYNRTSNPFERTKSEGLEQFLEMLKSKGVTATIRDTQGQDIEAACGQLVKLGQRKKAA